MEKNDRFLLAHGDGGLLTNKLIDATILKYLNNDILACLGDSANLPWPGEKICFTTDSYTVDPIFFPGGDIGSLSVYGTVNDLAVSGAKPLYLSLSFIIEEGFRMGEFTKILRSISTACRKAGVKVVTGDTKVVPKNKGDKIYINTSGIGIYDYPRAIGPGSISTGDVIILNGSIGAHGISVLLAREDFGIEANIVSDSQPLNLIIETLTAANKNIHCMRDATRGGVGTVLLELASQSGLDFEISETEIPIEDSVHGVCEILGLDPLYIANEGKFLLFCEEKDANQILDLIKNSSENARPAIIGRVTGKGTGRVRLRTSIGGTREIDMPVGGLLPRIC